jgi:phytoene dehydrogenase-like protein
MQIPSVHDDTLAPAGHHAASIYAMNFPVAADRSQHGHLKTVMAEKVMAKLERLAPGFSSLVARNTTFTGYHMDSMFAAPAGDFCHGLMHPDQMGAFRPGPRGWRDLPVPVDGLYLAGAGCYGGPGISFVPGYNAGYAVLEDLGLA